MRSLDELSRKRILITGGSGFIGRRLAGRLSEMGAEVHATSRISRESEAPHIKWWLGSMTDMETARKVLGEVRPDIIYHLAGEVTAHNDVSYVIPTFHSLLTSTINLLTLATEMGCDRVVLTGSSTEPLEDDPMPNSPYAAAKWATNAYGHLFYRLYKLPVVVVRPFMGYGPDQPRNKIIPFVINALLRGESPRLTNGLWVTDWVYIEDTIDGMLRATVLKENPGRTIDLGSGVLTSVRQVIDKVVNIMEPAAKPVFGAIPDRFVEHTREADTEFAFATLKWKAKVGLDEGLRTTVEWFRKHSRLNWYSLTFLDMEFLQEISLSSCLMAG